MTLLQVKKTVRIQYYLHPRPLSFNLKATWNVFYCAQELHYYWWLFFQFMKSKSIEILKLDIFHFEAAAF